MDYGAKASLPGYDVKSCADRFLVYSSAFLNLKILATFAVTGTVPPNGDGTFTVNATSNVFTSAAHGLSNGDMINFDTDGTLPGGLSKYIEEVDTFIFEPYGLIYYVISATTDTFQVSLTPGGSAVDITTTGSGTHYWYTDVNKIVITHNLGYLSPWIFSYNGIESSGGVSTFMADDFGQLNIRIYPNTTEIYIRQGFDNLSPGQTVYFTCYQFLDTFDSYTAPNIDTSTTSGATNDDYGIRISKAGFDVKTCDDVDCVLSSSFFSNIIHIKGNNSGTSITHDLGYLPSFLAYSKPSGKTYLVLASDKIAISTTGLSWSLYTGDSSYYVIFKNKSV